MRPLAAISSLAALWLASAAGAAEVPGQLFQRAQERGAVRVIVHLDVDAAPEAGLSRAARQAQRRAITRAQEGLEDALEPAWRSRVRRFRRFALAALEADAETLARLERSPWVREVEEDRLHRPLLGQSVPLIGGDLAHAAGIDGAGRAVAVLDTGFDTAHPFLAGTVVAEACFSGLGDCPLGGIEEFGAGSAAFCTYAEGCFHGTHVAGIAVGSGGIGFVGVAPAASLVAIQVFSEHTGNDCNGADEDPCALALSSDVVKGLEHVLDLLPSFPIDAVNLSIGYGSWSSENLCGIQNSALRDAIDALVAADVAVVASSGNEGFTNRITSPACIASALSVGASDDSDVVAGFSNSASFLDFHMPGVAIASSVPPAVLGFSWGQSQGTSLSAPHLSGTFALLRQAAPQLSLAEMVATLEATGVPLTDVKSGVTRPRVEIADAIAQICTTGPDADGDGHSDLCDNCTDTANASQTDSNGDDYGNACDADYGGDGVVGLEDYGTLTAAFGLTCADPGWDPDLDADDDCAIGLPDLARLNAAFGEPPGPSALAP